jgi:hypothetical protein
MAYALETVTVRNRLNGQLTNVKVLYAQSTKSTRWFSYLLDWRVVNVESQTASTVEYRRNVVLGTIPVKGETSVSTSIPFRAGVRGYWQVYFDYGGKQYKINKNNAQVNPWVSDDKKYVEITVRFEEKLRKTLMRIDFVMNSGNAYFYAEPYGCP